MSAVDYSYLGDTDDEQAKVAFYMTLFNQLRTRRVNFESQWEESSAMAWPDFVGSFTYGREIAPGAKRQQFQIDSSASVASHRFASIVEWLVTPQNLMWSRVKFSNPDLMRERAVKVWCRQVSQTLWDERYKWTANFVGQNSLNMHQLGVFGNMGMFIDELDDYLDPNDRGFRYIATPVGEIYVIADHQGRIVGFVRHFRLNAQQAKRKFPKVIVPVIEAALAISSQTLFDFLHIVRPRDDFNPFMPLTPRGKRYASTYISTQGFCILEEGGYRTLPLAYGRYMQAPEEDYGRGPAQMVLASLKTLNAEKRVFLKQGHRAGDPAYLVADTGLVDLKTKPGAFNAGGMSADGKPLVGILPTGEIQITKEMMDAETAIINDAFLVSLFKLILDNPEGMPNARQVVEYINERGIILFPTVGRQNTEYLGPLHSRELDILSGLRKLPPMPPVLKEARAERQMEFVNPIALAMRATATAGYVRTMEFAGEAIRSGADPSIMDIFELDEAIPEMGEDANAPVNWYASPQSLQRKRKQRADAAERERQTKELPGKAAIIKAQAVQTKAATGGNIGGTLSGVPPQQMPVFPGQS